MINNDKIPNLFKTKVIFKNYIKKYIYIYNIFSEN